MTALRQIRFTVHGKPAPQGSKQSYVPLDKKGNPYRRKGGGVMVQTVDSNKNSKPWMGQVRAAARDAYQGEVLRGAVRVTYWFYFQRPGCHFGTGKNSGRLKRSAPAHHTQKPDVDKLLRAINDALSGVIWADDSQVCAIGSETGKFWTTSGECAEILVEELE